MAGVTDSEGMSKKVFKALKKHEILREDNTVDTYKIGPNFAHHLAVINVSQQRTLVNVSYWCEEETHRLKKLLGEVEDLSKMIDDAEKQIAESNDDVAQREMLDQLTREKVRMKVRQRPSQRQPDVENDADNILVAFYGRGKSAPTITTGVMQPPQQRESPPQYYAI